MYNYIFELDELVECLFVEWGLLFGYVVLCLCQLLVDCYGVLVEVVVLQVGCEKCQYDVGMCWLWLFDYLELGQQVFQMVVELVLYGYLLQIDVVVVCVGFIDDVCIVQVWVGFLNYFVGVLVMFYMCFLCVVEVSSYDIELLVYQFGVGFEVVCYWLSMLVWCSVFGLLFFFICVDCVGNVFKCYLVIDFYFLQVGGLCLLWIVYEVFNQFGCIFIQIVCMFDGCCYFWLVWQVSSGLVGYGQFCKIFVVVLGCDLQYVE